MITIGIVEKIKKFLIDSKGDIGAMMGAGIMAIVTISVIAILASGILPSAINAIVNTSTVGWGAGAIAIWGTLSIFIVLAVLLLFVAIALLVMKMVDK